jgi:hypothetical protein
MFTAYYPGGAVVYPVDSDYDPQTRPWYAQVDKTIKVFGAHGGTYKYDPIITNYRAKSNGQLVLTVSLPIVT